MLFTKAFWHATLERSISTGGQFILYQVIGVGAVAGSLVPGEAGEALNAFGWNWAAILSAFCAGVFLCVVKCVATAKITDGGPSVINAEYLPRVDAKPTTWDDGDYEKEPPVS